MKVPRVHDLGQSEMAIAIVISVLKYFGAYDLDRIFRTVGAYFGFTTLRNQ